MLQRFYKITLLIVTLIVSVSILSVSSKTLAASCANSANYGTATWSVTIPATGQYNVWARVYAPTGNSGQFQLEIDGATCWQVGGGQALNSWVWVNWYGNNQSQKMSTTFTTTGTHTAKVIGSQANVQIDRIILLGADETCSDNTTVPTGNGNNCANAPTITPTPGSNGTTNGAVTTPVTSGSTTPAVVSQNIGNIAETTYIVDGKVVQKTQGAASLDTSKLSNGTHQVQAIVTLKDGQKLSQNESINVANKPNLFRIFGIALLVLAVFSFCGALVWLYVGKRHSRMYAQHHEQTTVSGDLVGQTQPIAVIAPDRKEGENEK